MSKSWGELLRRGDLSRPEADITYCLYGASSDEPRLSEDAPAPSIALGRDDKELRAAIAGIRRGALIIDSFDWSADVRTLRLLFSLAARAGVPVVSSSRALDPDDPAVRELWGGLELILLDHLQDRDDLTPAVAARARYVYSPRPPEGVLDSPSAARRRLGVSDQARVVIVLDDGRLGPAFLPALLEQLEAWKELSFAVVVVRAAERELDLTANPRLAGALVNLRLRIVPEEPLIALPRYLAAADLLVTGHGPRGIIRSATEQALLHGIATISYTEGPPKRSIFGTAVPLLTETGDAIARCSQLLRSEESRAPLREAGERWVRERSFRKEELVALPEGDPGDYEGAIPHAGPAEKAPLRLLMIPRERAKTIKGGDLVVMEELARELPKYGVEVTIDWEERERLSNFDLIQLFNFALRDDLESKARRCVAAGIPYTVATFYEDWPKFFTKMSATFFAMKAYVDAGQRPELWPEVARIIREIAPSEIWDNSWTATHAAALLVSGEEEARVIRRDYPQVKRIGILPVGCQTLGSGDGGALFTKETGLTDIVLCVGRFETRKNQLMTLKALEHEDYPLVFVGGGATVQPEYRELCMKFRRRGKTLFLERLAPELLASAYGAARVHVLPSWYELPGIVSMEAAVYGCNIVTSEYGTSREYFGDWAFYCDPQSPEAILDAIRTAYTAPRRPELAMKMREYTWEKSAAAASAVYRELVR